MSNTNVTFCVLKMNRDHRILNTGNLYTYWRLIKHPWNRAYIPPWNVCLSKIVQSFVNLS